MTDLGWLAGSTVRRCCVDQAVHIELSGSRSVTLTLEGEFSLTRQGQAESMSPADPQALGPILALVGAMVSSSHLTEAGDLTIEFAADTSLRTSPDPQFESWQIQSDDGLRIVCLPGGGLAQWGMGGPKGRV